MNRSTIAILGCGSIGRRHIKNLLTAGCNNLVAYDPVLLSRDTLKQETGLDAAADLTYVWEKKPAIAFITSSTQSHIPLALEAARRGCHLFIEKPLSHSLAQCEELRDELARSKRASMIGCNMRFHFGPRTVKSQIEQGRIGDVLCARIHCGSYLPSWRPQQDYRASYSASPEFGGAILDIIHEIDLACWYFGEARVVGSAVLPARSLQLTTDGAAEIILAHSSGVLSSVHLNYLQRDYCRTCQVIGSCGSIYWDFAKRRVDVLGEDGNPADSFAEPTDEDVNSMYLFELKHFLSAVENGTDSGNEISAATNVLRIALTVRESGVKV